MGSYNYKSAYWFTLLNKETADDLCNSYLEIIFILQGTGWLSFEQSDKLYKLNVSDIFVINNYEMHLLKLEKDALAISLSIAPEFMAMVCPDIISLEVQCKSFLYPQNRQEKFDVLRQELSKAFQIKYKNDQNDSQFLRSSVIRLLGYLVQNFRNISIQRQNPVKRQKLLDVFDYVQRHYNEKITLEDLSKKVYLNRSYISHCFSKYLGISFYEYLSQVRLFHAELLLHGNNAITEIAQECGFPNSNAITSVFKKYRNTTPREYRKLLNSNVSTAEGTKLTANETVSDALSIMEKYAGKWENNADGEIINDILVDINGGKQKITKHWKRVINAGYARDILDWRLQDEIREIQNSIGFEYIRCKGVLNDDMFIYSADYYGGMALNFAYLNEVIDFILSVHSKPMLELGSMPSVLVSQHLKGSLRPLELSPPNNYELWKQLISDITQHLADRYGEEKVKTWLFSPWISIDHIGCMEPEEYFKTYQTAYNAIKNVCMDFLVCGPGSMYYRKYLTLFLQKCSQLHCIPDVITFRSSPSASLDEEENEIEMITTRESISQIISSNPDILMQNIRDIKDILNKELQSNKPIILEEWTNNTWQWDLCNDTCYKSAYIFKNILENNHSVNGLGYFSINDRLDEIAPSTPSVETFHGGFGLFTVNNIPKSAYRAMELIAKMGNSLLKRGDGYYISAEDDVIQVFLYNYCHYDMLYRYSHITNLTNSDRYRVFVKGKTHIYHIRFEHLLSGTYKIKQYSISPKEGSTYDAWVKIGSPEPMDAEETLILSNLSHPLYTTESKVIKSEEPLVIKASLMPHEVMLIQIRRTSKVRSSPSDGKETI